MHNKLSAPLDEFKERELEIINLMAGGLSNQEIADQLFITKETVRWYNKQIYSKLGTSRRTEAIALAREMGLIGDQETQTSQSIQHKLPVTVGPFIGRDDELDQLSSFLDDPNIRLISLVGTGGMGKSRLSLEIAHQVKANYEHGAVFIDLTPIRNPDDISKFAVTSLGLSIGSSQSPREVLFNYLREKELLLIFDNFEHILSAAKLLSDILEVAPNVTMIATSRERLNLRVETVFYLQPVTKEANRLFIEVATMIRPHIVIGDEEHADVQRIVQLVGGLPLGLILAATWVDTLSVKEIADEIQVNLDFLSAEMGDMPERQRSIHAVIDPTWKRLNEKEQEVFMWASVFRGGFTRETFQQVTRGSIRALQTLLNRSLFNHGHGRRYDMHPLLRQYAREKLESANMLGNAKNAHLQTFMDYAQIQAERMYSGYYLESLDALELEADNIRAALDWSLQGNHIEQGVALILANGEFWLARSRSLEAIAYVEKAIQQSDHPKLYYWQAVYLDRLGQIERSTEAARYLIEYGEAKRDPALLAYGQIQLGLMQNTKEEARPLLESALSNAMKTDDQHLIANCHSCLALISPDRDTGQSLLDDTDSHLQQALEIYETLGDLRGISRVTNNIALQHYDDQERIHEAKELMKYSLQLKREIGDRAGKARRLTTLSMWAMAEEEFEQAQQWLVESREICEELGEQDRLSYALTTEGLLYLLMMNLEQAQATLERSLQIHVAIKDYKGVVDIYGFLCQLHLLQQNLTDARLSLLKGFEVATKEYSLPSTLMIAYANYLWYQHELSACVPIVALFAQQTLNTYSGSETIVNHYILQPLIYRVQQHIGDELWQKALDDTKKITVEQIFQEIVKDIQPE